MKKPFPFEKLMGTYGLQCPPTRNIISISNNSTSEFLVVIQDTSAYKRIKVTRTTQYNTQLVGLYTASTVVEVLPLRDSFHTNPYWLEEYHRPDR